MKLPFAFACALLLASCKKNDLDPDNLVPATRVGKNTGDFPLNGQPYRPGRGSAYPGSTVGAFWSKIRGGRKITVVMNRLFDRDDTGINLVLPRITGPGTFTITDGVSPVVIAGDRPYISYRITAPSPPRQFLTGPTAVGRVEVTRYDTVAHVISGTFKATLREYQGLDSVVLTKGRFDCKF